jgi:hypothetical protein
MRRGYPQKLNLLLAAIAKIAGKWRWDGPVHAMM